MAYPKFNLFLNNSIAHVTSSLIHVNINCLKLACLLHLGSAQMGGKVDKRWVNLASSQ